MPFVLDKHEASINRPAKRRKLFSLSRMAGNKELSGGCSASDSPLENDLLDFDCEMTDREARGGVLAGSEVRTSDREELMQCIKRGQRPTWVPKPSLQALSAEENALSGRLTSKCGQEQPAATTLHAAQEIEEDIFSEPWYGSRHTPARGRAFHSGDFHNDEHRDLSLHRNTNIDGFVEEPSLITSTSPPPWLTEIPRPLMGRTVSDPRAFIGNSVTSVGRGRTPSLGSSLSSSFIMRTPTSPLVHAVNNSNTDIAPTNIQMTGSRDDERKNRRRTMPHYSFQYLGMSPTDMTPDFARPGPTLRRESTMPCWTHKPRRSLGSFTYQPGPSPHIPQVRARRPSLSSDVSPRQRTSMVGSFEESILRGRMSSPASQPFDFVAQIGVMGKGNCPASLKCPAHVSVPFHAVFYNYATSLTTRSIADDAPSPYVGIIDIENNLKPVHLGAKRRRVPSAEEERPQSSITDPTAPENTSIGRALSRDMRKERSQASSPKVDLGGAYRVPQQGQLQIVIKNANKTAVKLFLVPYDLEGMESGTKTFVRQRSYSSGPIVDEGPKMNTGAACTRDPLKDKNILRYLIHLKFCSPAKGRFYLHDSIRIVFANRVPDGKEKLRNEIQLPEPRYSSYRPAKTPSKSARTSLADLTLHELQFGSSPVTLDGTQNARMFESPSIPEELPDLANTTPSPLALRKNRRIHTSSVHGSGIKTDLFQLSELSSPPAANPNPDRTLSPVQGFLPSTSARSSPIPWGSGSSSTIRSFSPGPVEAGDGLLSRQFRNLNGFGDNTGADVESQEITNQVFFDRLVRKSVSPENTIPKNS